MLTGQQRPYNTTHYTRSTATEKKQTKQSASSSFSSSHSQWCEYFNVCCCCFSSLYFLLRCLASSCVVRRRYYIAAWALTCVDFLFFLQLKFVDMLLLLLLLILSVVVVVVLFLFFLSYLYHCVYYNAMAVPQCIFKQNTLYVVRTNNERMLWQLPLQMLLNWVSYALTCIAAFATKKNVFVCMCVPLRVRVCKRTRVHKWDGKCQSWNWYFCVRFLLL